MEKNIKDYLHLYYGCQCEYNWYGVEDDVPTGERGRKIGTMDWIVVSDLEAFEPKPILRPLSDMTEEEIKELDATKVFVRATPVHMVGNMQWTPESYRWVLSKSFDLFGLIDAGLALDKTKLTAHA